MTKKAETDKWECCKTKDAWAPDFGLPIPAEGYSVEGRTEGGLKEIKKKKSILLGEVCTFICLLIWPGKSERACVELSFSLSE